MDKLLLKYIQSPKDPYLNFELAIYYKNLKHYAGACTYFLRAAEWGDLEQDKGIIYESLIQISLCFKELGNRKFSEEGWLLHAVSLSPDRPEALWLLSNVYKEQGKWQEANMISSFGLVNAKNALPMIIDIGYRGDYVLGYNQVQSAWYSSKLKEARKLLYTLPERFDLDEEYLQLIQKDINNVGDGAPYGLHVYNKDKYNSIRFKFKDLHNIETNYAQAYQDIFVLSALDGKRDGFYLEIGSSFPKLHNNTYLLETQFNWEGISIDNAENTVEEFKKERKNPVFCKDATIINYNKLLKDNNAPEIIDYLQIDCEPAYTSYKVLTSIPFDKYKFRTITFEHDYAADVYKKVKDLSRRYLTSLGYLLIADSISVIEGHEFEDWWVHPDLINKTIIDKLYSVTGKGKVVSDYMFPGKKDITSLYSNFD
jgi:hypothetical protein